MERTTTRGFASAIVMAFATLTLFVASAIHFGLQIPLGDQTLTDPFPGAAVPEAVIAVALAIGLVMLLLAPAGRAVALGATLFAIAGVLVGISITFGGARIGDIEYHVVLLAALLANLVVLGTEHVPALLGRRLEGALALRAVALAEAALFLAAAAQNFGARIAVGPIDWYFVAPIAQAGIGEAFIGVTLLAAAAVSRATLFWIGYALTVVGIVFGLLSDRVVGPAREIHLVMLPLALAALGLLAARRASSARRSRLPAATRSV